jgi:glycosyltransferase involved in cell wall biosynthesis
VRICLVSTYAETGGAAIAARRLHQGLLRSGADAQFLTGERTSGQEGVFQITPCPEPIGKRLRQFWFVRKVLFLERFTSSSATWSSNLIPRNIAPAIRGKKPDIINLHWTGHDFLPIQKLTGLQGPIVWTMHDAWAATGGCHYTGGCMRFATECRFCPQLTVRPPLSGRMHLDLAQMIFRQKAKYWKGLDISVVTPSEWLAKIFRASALFKDKKIEVIPYGVDIDIFRPLDRIYARACFQLPQDKLLVLFGGVAPIDDPRKGYKALVPALQEVARKLGDRFAFVILGSHRKPDIGVQGHAVGKLRDEASLPLVYSACDLLVIPSLEDNSPNMAYEAAACGIPCIAFETGGLPEIVLDGRTGRVVPTGDSRALAEAILTLLGTDAVRTELASAGRRHAEKHFGLQCQSSRYLKLFGERIAQGVKPPSYRS